tara:strand:+ start:4927 stop:5904 length:978 start_codon:yes stop_codon:yes gene_type:complete
LQSLTIMQPSGQRTRWAALALSGTLIATAAGPLSAAPSRATASASDLTLTLTDLDPDDGATPTIRFPGASVSLMPKSMTYVTTVLGQSLPGKAPVDPGQITTIYPSGLYSPVSLRTSNDTAAQEATVVGSGRADPMTMSLSVAVIAGAVGDNSSAMAGLFGARDLPMFWYYSNFSLSPHTAVLVSILATDDASIDERAAGGGYQTASALTLLYLGAQRPGIITAPAFAWSVVAPGCITAPDQFVPPNCTESALSSTQRLSLTFTNASNESVFGYLGVAVQASATYDAPLPAVPEPTAWALWTLGAALLGWRRGFARGDRCLARDT